MTDEYNILVIRLFKRYYDIYEDMYINDRNNTELLIVNDQLKLIWTLMRHIFPTTFPFGYFPFAKDFEEFYKSYDPVTDELYLFRTTNRYIPFPIQDDNILAHNPYHPEDR